MSSSERRLHDALFLFASVVPLLIILRLASVALYASPETDDFCFSYHYAADGLFGTVAIFYKTAIGRILPMVILTLPAMIARAIPLDMFLVYPLLMAVFFLAFAAVIGWVCAKLWPHVSGALAFFLGTTLTATICANALSFREMFFWLPGVACYLVPAALFLIVFTTLMTSAIEGALLSIRSTAILSILCFLAATCNEFTPVWFMAIIAGSFAARGFTQFRQHAVLAASTLAGFLVLLAAPGNWVRMSQYPAGGRIWTALDGALNYFAYDWLLLIQEPSVLAWLAIVGSASIFVIHAKPIRLRTVVLISVGIPVLLLACSFITWFIAYYATGELLALRARNETVVFIIAGLTFSVAIITRFAAQFLPDRPAQVQAVGAILCALLCLHLIDGRTMALLREQRPSFDTFWLESLQRHANIRLSKASDIIVPNRTVRPSLLMQEDLTDNPGRLPNDCVAAFYGKRSVILR
jgi:hypothetical protein